MQKKVILLTGASSGFGKLTVPLLLKRGHIVLAGIRGGRDRLRQLFSDQKEMLERGQLRAIDLHMDQPESFDRATVLLKQEFQNRLDVLINNAGFGLMGPAELHSGEEIRHQFEVNFFGPYQLTSQLMPALRAAKGRILNVSSVGGTMGFPFYDAYVASKYALEGYTECLYYAARDQGISVGLIEPGGFGTSFLDAAQFGKAAQEPNLYSEKIKNFQEMMNTVGKKSVGNPLVVAKRLVRLCERKRIPFRTLVGMDARFLSYFRFILPLKAWLGAIAYFFNKILKGS